MVTRRVRLTGLVQGVFFRAWARDEARRFAVNGWVRNCPDGSVEAHVEGDEHAVRQMVERLRHGPPGARVDDLEIDVAEPEGVSGFEVRS
jgi:acylphosphatase